MALRMLTQPREAKPPLVYAKAGFPGDVRRNAVSTPSEVPDGLPVVEK